MTVKQDPRLAMQCRSASRVKTRQGWHAAVRHTGLLFQLPLPPLPTPPCQSDTSTETAAASLGKGADHVTEGRLAGSEAECPAGQEAAEALPYPQLSQTVSSTNFAPAAHLAEHYSPPGGDPSRATCTWLPCPCNCNWTTSAPCVTPLCFLMSFVDACQGCCVLACNESHSGKVAFIASCAVAAQAQDVPALCAVTVYSEPIASCSQSLVHAD